MSKLVKDTILQNVFKGTIKTKLVFIGHGPEVFRANLMEALAQHNAGAKVLIISLDFMNAKEIFAKYCKHLELRQIDLIGKRIYTLSDLLDNLKFYEQASDYQNYTVVVDSFDYVLLRQCISTVSEFTDFLKNYFKRAFCFFSNDLITDALQRKMRDECGSYITFERLPPTVQHLYQVQMLIKRPNTKICMEITEFGLKIQLNLKSDPCIRIIRNVTDQQDLSPDIELPVGMMMEEEEKDKDKQSAREDKEEESEKPKRARTEAPGPTEMTCEKTEHVLPYMRIQSSPAPGEPQPSTSKVFYLPDKNDDVDEEDPDDDLGF